MDKRKLKVKYYLLVWRDALSVVRSCRFDDFESLDDLYKLLKANGISCFWKEVI